MAKRSTGKTALLLVNRKARQGDRRTVEIETILREGGLTLVTASGRDLAALVRKHAGKVDLVIVGGGDGSLNAALPGLLESKLPLGILPLGTANDLARTLNIPADPLAAARLIVAGRLRAVDVGTVNGHPFFNVASIGFSAELAKQLTGEAKKKWGKLGYALAALRILVKGRPFTAEITHDGQVERVKTFQVSVGNGRFYGGGMTVQANAAPDDGRLDVYSLEVAHWSGLLMLLPFLRWGWHGWFETARAFPATKLTVRTRKPHSINADGELVGQTPAVFGILPKAVKVFVP